MRRIAEALEACRRAGRLGFIPYLTAGDPDADTTVALVQALAEEGADIVELGVPFSDPLADGVTNQRAAERALAAGMTLDGALAVAARIRHSQTVPLVLFTYFNPIFRMGVEEFARRAARAGVDGVLVTDLPPDEGEPFHQALTATGLDPIYMLSPTSGPERERMVAARTRAFIYYVSRAGVTGERDDLPAGLRADVSRLRLATGKPVAVGFGVSRPEHLAELAGAADAAVVGSALVRRLAEAPDQAAALASIRALVRELLAGRR